MHQTLRSALPLLVLSLTPLGCTHPSEDNIRLRKLNQGLRAQVSDLTTQNEARQRVIVAYQQRTATIPTLPPAELKKLWVATGVKFGRLSGGVDLDDKKPGDEGVRIYCSPTDDAGASIQAAGSFVVEAFDLAEPGDNRLGRWTFDAMQSKSLWRAFLFEFGYELTCPWQKQPRHGDITVRVTFTDELTHLPYVAEQLLHARIPLPAAAGAPTSSPAR